MKQYGKVTLLADNQVPAWTATTEETGFEASHLTDGNEITIWKPTTFASAQTMTYDQGTALISSFLTSVFDAGATSPSDISFAPDATLWVTDIASDKIYNIEQDGTWISEFPTSAFDVLSNTPTAISCAPDGTLWVNAVNQARIYNVKQDGTLISSFPTSAFDGDAVGVSGISLAPDGTLWVTDGATDKIYNIEQDGTLISSFLTSVFDAGATSPTGISHAPDGTLWVTDGASETIYNIETDGTLISSFATSVFDAGATTPTGISHAPDGTLWIVDTATDKIYNTKILLAFDSLFISGHNLNTVVDGFIKWQYSDNGITWIDIVERFNPIDNKSIGLRIPAMRTTRAVRFSVSDLNALPYIAIAIVTRKTEIDFADLYDPHRIKKNRNVNRTLHGQVSDITDYYSEHILDLKFSNSSDSVYQKVKKYFNDQPSDVIGAYWEPNFHPHELWPMSLDSDELNAPFVVSGTLRNISIRLKGVVE